MDEDENGLGISVYCVNCGVNAGFEVTSGILFTLLHGFTDSYVEVRGDLQAELQVDIMAEYKYKAELVKKRVVTAAIPELSIPRVIAVGPIITVDVECYLEVELQGHMLARIILEMPNSAYVKDSSKSYPHGWTPAVTNTFEVGGEVGLTLRTDMPIGNGFVLDLLNGKFDLQVSIGTSETCSTPLSDINDGQCPGILWDFEIDDNLDLNVIDLYEASLWRTAYTIVAGCITL